MFIHNLWEEDEIETVSIYLPVSIYNLVDPIESPEVLIVEQLQWSYQHQFWLTVKGHRLLDPLTKVFIKVEEETKFFAERAIAISLHIDNSASEIQYFDLPLLDELSCFMEYGLGSFEEFYKSKQNKSSACPNKLNLFIFSFCLFILILCTVII